MPRKVAIFETKKGNITIELFDKETPNTVANFEKLVMKGFYNGLKFHRVISGFVAQAGCPLGTGTGAPGYNTDCEIVPSLTHKKGILAMAHAGTCRHDKANGAKTAGNCSNGSQFYITLAETPHLNGVHTVFGKVISGMDVVEKIAQNDVIEKLRMDFVE